jgi:hypothetical protein
MLVLVGGFNSTNSTEVLEFAENNIIRDLDDGYCPPDYYGPGPLDDLLDRWCETESDCPIIDGLGRGQDLVYRQYCDRLLEPEREWNDNDDGEFVPDK